MLRGLRSNSLPLPPAGASPLVQSLEGDLEFMDIDGVPRRMSGVSIPMRLFMRGTSVGDFSFVRGNNGFSLHDDPAEESESRLEDETELPPLTLDEQLALERARHAKMLRRKQLIIEIRDRKQELLQTQQTQIFERLQLWHDALELDPAIELTQANTALSPSSKANTFIDDDGNIRRKSIYEASAPKEEMPPNALLASLAAVATVAPHKSAVLEFIHIILDD